MGKRSVSHEQHVPSDQWNAEQAIVTRRRSRVYEDKALVARQCRKWARHYNNSLVMYELRTVMVSAEYNSDRVRRVPHEITAPSLRGLAQGAPCWSFAYVEYALSQWSLDEALDRITRAVNMRTPLSCHQFLTLCHNYDSIQHVPDVWVRDILGVEQVPVTRDCIGALLYPGDVVAMVIGSRVGSSVITGMCDDIGFRVNVTTLNDVPDPTHSWDVRAGDIVKLSQEQVDCMRPQNQRTAQ